MASVSDSDISDAESIMLDRDEGTSLRGRLGVGPPGCCSEDEAVAPNPKSAIFSTLRHSRLANQSKESGSSNLDFFYFLV